MNNRSSRKSMLVRHLLIVCCALVGGPIAMAQSRTERCSNWTLRGDYGFKIDGQILAGPKAGLLRGLAMTHFDGRGELSQVDFTTINGIPTGSDWRPATGTYSVDSDCTGKAQLDFTDGSPSLHLRLVVVKEGREIHAIVEGNATGGVGVRVGVPHLRNQE